MTLLDTHVLVWASIGSPQLSPRAAHMLADKEQALCVSAASAWEIATKIRLGKLPDADLLILDFEAKLRGLGFTVLSVAVEHFLLAGSFPMTHKDPFDRLIAAQARIENIPLLSADPALDQFPIQRIW